MSASPYDSQVCKSLETWTDGLPICKQCGVGYQTNQWYKEGGGRLENHESEDRFVHRKCQQSVSSLYCVFDGHDGAHVADFAAQRLPAELLLGQLEVEMNEQDVKDALKKAFESVENGYRESIDDVLVQKFNLQAQLPDDMGSFEAVRRFPNLVHRLNSIEKEISGGAAAVVAFIHSDMCYVANVGNARALLCTVNSAEELSVQQLSVDHTLSNPDECDRLAASHWKTETVAEHMVHNMATTRSLGDYCIKASLQDMDSARKGTQEPIIAEPSIWGGRHIDPSFYFLVLLSSGLYKAIEEATDTKDANVELVNMIVSELPHQSTIQGLAQAVVDKVCRMHQDCFAQTDGKECRRRDDMTLLLRLFTAKLGCGPGSSASSPTSPLFHPVSIPFTGSQARPSLSLIMPAQSSSQSNSPRIDTPESAGSETTPPTAVIHSSATLSAPSASPGACTSNTTDSFQQVRCSLGPSDAERQSLEPNVPLVLDIDAPQPLNLNSSEQLLVPMHSDAVVSQANAVINGTAEGGQQQRFNAAWAVAAADGNGEQPEGTVGEDRTQFLNNGPAPMEIGRDKKVAAYVDFSNFFAHLEADGGESVIFREFMKEPR